jgi:hypothetical protein
MRNYLVLGDWNAICDRCGLKFKASMLKKEWTGLMVCSHCWEPRHPQTLIRVPEEQIATPWARPEAEDVFIGPTCYLFSISAYADVGTADCMQADNAQYPFPFLYNLSQGN